MTTKQKIITMAKLALYDKREGEADRAVINHFRHDYIYRKNLGTRLCVGIGSAFIVLGYWLQRIITQGLDAVTLDLSGNIRDSVLFVLAVLAVYTVIGTIQGTRQYYLAQKRLERYFGLLRILDRIEERADRRQRMQAYESEEGPVNRYGTNTRRKGNNR
jgi:hypothetical protein